MGCVMLAPDECMGECLEQLKDHKAFYDLRHQIIFSTLSGMYNDQAAIDVITLQQRLKDQQLLEQVGGIGYLAMLPDDVPSAANLSYYLDIVREKFELRRWIALCAEIVSRIYESEGEVEPMVAQISTDLFKLCEAGIRTSEKTMREVWVAVNEQYISKFRRGVKHKIGPMTGFNYLDNILPGFGPGQLIVMAARPRTGKSAIIMQMAEHIAMNEKTPVAVFSLEMSAASLGARAVFQRAGADMTKFLNGFMSDEDVQKLTNAGDELARCGIYVDEAPRMCIEDLEIRARRMVRRLGVKVIFVDYFQLLYVRNRHKQWSKSDELAECSMRLKGLAKELGIPIVICAQMNREIEKETHRRPRLSDLKDTGQLEQDGDVVMFLWKPDISSDRWKKRVSDILARMDMVPWDWRVDGNGQWKKNLAIVTCTVEKQREGRSGEDAVLMFIKPWTRFVDPYARKSGSDAESGAVLEPQPSLSADEEGAAEE